MEKEEGCRDMASDVVVPVVAIQGIREHSNADSLELCDVLGYQMCIPKGRYKDGDVVVYFPSDVLIPLKWAEEFGVARFLIGKNHDRVGKIKLRGEPSFGLVAPIPAGQDWQVGDNVAEFFGVTKYEPPIRVRPGDQAAYDLEIDSQFRRYTDIQNGRIFIDYFEEGEEVVATEKIHGTNSRVGIIDGERVAGSMSYRRKPPEAPETTSNRKTKVCTYWFPWEVIGVEKLLTELGKSYRSVVLYGEICGRSIQRSHDYGTGNSLGYRAFDLCFNGKFVGVDDFIGFCERFDVPMVPILYRGAYDLKTILSYADGKTTVSGNHCREGVVVRPVHERFDEKLGSRLILKYIGTEYSLSKHSDFTDV